MSNPADPSTWPLAVKLLAGWGPLGIGWILAEVRRVRTERSRHLDRDAAAREIRLLHERHEKAIKGANDAHLATVKENAEEHQRQLQEISVRFFNMIERHSGKSKELLDKVDQKKLSSSDGDE